MYLAGKLKHRFQIKIPVQTPNTNGGFTRSYTTLDTIWGELKNIGQFTQMLSQAVRGEQVNNRFTHRVTVRWLGIKNLGREYSIAFDDDFKNMGDINNIKAQWFLFKEDGSPTKGRLFRVLGTVRDERLKEFVNLEVQEIEEHGTGWKT